jgi:hypothetical protein
MVSISSLFASLGDEEKPFHIETITHQETRGLTIVFFTSYFSGQFWHWLALQSGKLNLSWSGYDSKVRAGPYGYSWNSHQLLWIQVGDILLLIILNQLRSLCITCIPWRFHLLGFRYWAPFPRALWLCHLRLVLGTVCRSLLVLWTSLQKIRCIWGNEECCTDWTRLTLCLWLSHDKIVLVAGRLHLVIFRIEYEVVK